MTRCLSKIHFLLAAVRQSILYLLIFNIPNNGYDKHFFLYVLFKLSFVFINFTYI